MASDMDMFAPNTTKIDEFIIEEVTSEDLGVLAEFQRGKKSTSTAGSVEGSGSENITKDDDVVRHELLVCQPCDEDGEVIAERKTNSRGVGVVGVNGQVAARMYEYNKKVLKKRPYRCKQRGCKYKAKQRGSIKLHLANIHNIGVTWHTCPQEGCEYKAKRRSNVKRHLADIHDIGVTWHPCPQEGCEYKARQRSTIKRHLANIHDIGVTWHTCPQEGCEYKTKERGTIKQHLADIHDIGVTWHTCQQEGCEYKAKQRGNIKTHLAVIHDIGVS